MSRYRLTLLLLLLSLGAGCSANTRCASEEDESMCVKAFELSATSEVDGNGAVFWQVSGNQPYKDASFLASDGRYGLLLQEPPQAPGNEVDGGTYHVATLGVIDPTVFDLHRLPVGELSEADQESLETALEPNLEAFATSCTSRLVHVAGELREPSWVSAFAEGYSCASVGPYESGQPSYVSINCSELTLKQGECLGIGNP